MEIKKCIIPVAGRGTRFMPVTKTVSKEMLPIVNKPTILYLVLECIESGIEEIIFVVNEYNERLLKDFFSIDPKLEEFLGTDKVHVLDELKYVLEKVSIHFIKQSDDVKGTGGSVYAAREFIEDEYFAVMFGDDLIDSSIPVVKQLINVHNEFGCNVVGVGEVSMELVSNYGVVKYDEEGFVETLVEKPDALNAPSNHVVQGRYIISSDIFEYILKCEAHKNNEYYLPEALLMMDGIIRACKIEGTYYDIGSHLGYIKANIAYGLKREFSEELKDFINKIE